LKVRKKLHFSVYYTSKLKTKKIHAPHGFLFSVYWNYFRIISHLLSYKNHCLFSYQFGGDAHLLILNEELKIAAHIYSRDLGGCTVDVRV